MKALSVKQPWASMIADGPKTIETRTRGTKWRGELLICSSASPKNEGPAGVALAVVDLVNCRPMTQDDEDEACCQFEPGRVAWELENVRKLERPFRVTGKRGVFEVDESELPHPLVFQSDPQQGDNEEDSTSSNVDEKEESAASAEPEQDGEPLPVPLPLPSRLVERLPVKLTPKERMGKHEELRNVLDDMDEARAEGAAAAAEMKATLKDLQKRQDKLRRHLRLDEERRPVECARRMDFKTRMVSVVRLDTGDTVRTRPMTDDELQLELPSTGQPEIPAGEDWQGEIDPDAGDCDAHVGDYVDNVPWDEQEAAEAAAQEAHERAQEGA